MKLSLLRIDQISAKLLKITKPTKLLAQFELQMTPADLSTSSARPSLSDQTRQVRRYTVDDLGEIRNSNSSNNPSNSLKDVPYAQLPKVVKRENFSSTAVATLNHYAVEASEEVLSFVFPKDKQGGFDIIDSVNTGFLFSHLIESKFNKASNFSEDKTFSSEFQGWVAQLSKFDLLDVLSKPLEEDFKNLHRKIISELRSLLFKKLSQSEEEKVKFDLILAYHEAKENLPISDSWIFFKSCIEGVGLLFNAYTKAILVKQNPDGNFKVKRLPSNSKSRYGNEPIYFVSLAGEEIEFMVINKPKKNIGKDSAKEKDSKPLFVASPHKGETTPREFRTEHHKTSLSENRINFGQFVEKFSDPISPFSKENMAKPWSCLEEANDTFLSPVAESEGKKIEEKFSERAKKISFFAPQGKLFDRMVRIVAKMDANSIATKSLFFPSTKIFTTETSPISFSENKDRHRPSSANFVENSAISSKVKINLDDVQTSFDALAYSPRPSITVLRHNRSRENLPNPPEPRREHCSPQIVSHLTLSPLNLYRNHSSNLGLEDKKRSISANIQQSQTGPSKKIRFESKETAYEETAPPRFHLATLKF